MARAVLAAAGLKEGDYSLDQLDMGQHVNAMTAGTFDAGYTLEPNAAVMRKNGVATTLEAGRDREVHPRRPERDRLGRRRRHLDRLHEEPAGRRASATRPRGRRRSTSSTPNPKEARKSLVKNTFTPDDVVDTVPLVKFTNVADLTQPRPRRVPDASSTTRRSIGTLPERVDVNKYLGPVLMADAACNRLPARELARLVREKRASAVEVLDAHLAAIERANPPVNAVVTLAAEPARAAARAATARSRAARRCRRSTAYPSASRTSRRPPASAPRGARRSSPITSRPRTPRS